jgi:hypothetical protein
VPLLIISVIIWAIARSSSRPALAR